MKNNWRIINVKEFKGEYTAIFVNTIKDLEVNRCNYVCADCGLSISDFTKKNIEGAYTFNKGICNLCGENTLITSVGHYN